MIQAGLTFGRNLSTAPSPLPKNIRLFLAHFIGDLDQVSISFILNSVPSP